MKLHQLDRAFCVYVQKKANGSVERAFTMLVTAILYGNGEYVNELCRQLGAAGNMLRAAEIILKSDF
jgi:hypothetical protein